MVYHERAAWSGLIGTVIALGIYVALLMNASTNASDGDITRVDWLAPMLWSIGTGIALSILISILWGIAAGMRDRESATASDIRDRDISRMGGRVEQAFLVIAGLGVIALCAFEADLFWIANTMFAGFAISSFVGGIARVIAYRRGLI